MSAELVALCQQALDLTFRQRLAIKQGRWKDLQNLLDLREKVLSETGALLDESADPGELSEAGSVLEQMREHNDTNIRILSERKREVAARLGCVLRGNRALASYQGALRGGRFDSGALDRQR